MKKLLIIPALVLSLLNIKAQIKSSHDGFYKQDSVFYELTGTDSFQYCVNCYSADSLQTYHGGVWIYSREHSPNTWENNRFSNNKDLADTSSIRPDVVKGNTVWVRILKDGKYTDEHHFVFLGSWKPKTAQVISLFLDSSDLMGRNGFYGAGLGMNTNKGYRWNYRLKIEKKCTYEVFAGLNWQVEAQQNAGLEISAQESADYPDKALQLNAANALSRKHGLVLGPSITDSLGMHIKTLRLRLGGSNHRNNIIANEIALSILRPDLGGVPSMPVCVFLNGSFWTYALAEEGMGASHIASVLGIPNTHLVTAKVPPVLAVGDLKKTGLTFNPISESIFSVCGFINVCPVFYTYHDTIQFHLDSNEVRNAAVFENLCKAVYNGSDSLVAATIDKENFYRYTLAIWFFQNPDSWGNHLTIAQGNLRPWKLFGEHFDFQADSAEANDWDKYFTNYEGGKREALPWQATKKMLHYDKDYFCLVLEDELNTTYKAERTIPVAQKKISSLRPCVSECNYAWGRNDWPDSVSWEQAVGKIVPFLKQRPNAIAKALPKVFMNGADTLLGLKDRNTVTVKFDKVPGKDVTVRLNSLEIKKDFTGEYYPKPNLRVSLQYDTNKYEFVRWLEFPEEAASFSVSASKPVTLTPVMRLKN